MNHFNFIRMSFNLLTQWDETRVGVMWSQSIWPTFLTKPGQLTMWPIVSHDRMNFQRISTFSKAQLRYTKALSRSLTLIVKFTLRLWLPIVYLSILIVAVYGLWLTFSVFNPTLTSSSFKIGTIDLIYFWFTSYFIKDSF